MISKLFSTAIAHDQTTDKLHAITVIHKEDGTVLFNQLARCDQIKVRPVSFTEHDKVTIKMRPGLLCLKCFGHADPIRSTFYNAIVV